MILTPATRAALAPTGALRAAINLGNPILARRDADGAPRGVSVDLAQALAAALGVPFEPVVYAAAGAVVADAAAWRWDLAFLAVDPTRAETIAFSRPYVGIDGAFVVPADADFRGPAELDRAGVTIAVGTGAAYALHLARTLTQARLIRVETSAAVFPALLAGAAQAGAGVRQPAQAFAAAHPGWRVVEPPFMAIRQALAVPRAAAAALGELEAFLDARAAEGWIARRLAAHDQDPALALARD